MRINTTPRPRPLRWPSTRQPRSLRCSTSNPTTIISCTTLYLINTNISSSSSSIIIRRHSISKQRTITCRCHLRPPPPSSGPATSSSHRCCPTGGICCSISCTRDQNDFLRQTSRRDLPWKQKKRVKEITGEASFPTENCLCPLFNASLETHSTF
uniref:(northern house mosquito) hypothetical protein n=1 Tax=Culex pipiens TaxID=7175 RepID=A0A8D8ABQ1_CULPI